MKIAVVGGGIVGLSCAYYLCQRGVDVTVFEKGTIGSGNTERSAGGIRTQFASRPNIRLSKASVAVWERFETLFDEDIGYRRPGYLFVARTEGTADRLREAVAVQNEEGIDSQFLAPGLAAEKSPCLDQDAIVGATYHSADGYADPHLALQAFARETRAAGADIRTNTPVTEITIERKEGDRRATGVEAAGERVPTDFVVNAAGAWSGRLAAEAGLELPLTPRRIQIAIVEPSPGLPGSTPMVIDLDGDCYFRPEREGRALVGGGTSHGGYDPGADPDRLSHQLDLDYALDVVESASHVADCFGPESRIVSGWAGAYNLTPDHAPIIEESVPGLITATGHSGHGFMHAPATGEIVSEIVVDGEASLMDVSGFSSDRFTDRQFDGPDLTV